LFDVKTGLIIKQIVIKHKEDDPGKHDLVDPFAVDSTSPSATKEAEQVMPPNGP
jgi:hypothetical protein